jgi:predicted O-methyltransferase YrrM
VSTDWASGYVTDLGYTHGFYRELTPAILRFAALAKGFETCIKPSGAITYCELGCGQGFSANLLAAANPEMELYATDFNPEQISGARRLAEAASSTNIHFFDDSFAQFEARKDLPQFDIIALHGIYSWIAKEHRGTIMRFIEARLKPGGLVYISYNCLPGWAGVSPLRQLMRMAVTETAGSLSSKIDASFASIEQLEAVGARYFKANPSLKVRLDKMKDMSRNYLAHEYLNADWSLFYHSDIAAELSGARLSYVASAHLIDHVDSINLTGDQQSFLQSIPESAKRETLRDYIVNQQFRRDIFGRGAIALPVGELRDKWLDSQFALTTPAEAIPLKVTGILGEASLQEKTYKPLIEAFAGAGGAVTLRQILGSDKALAGLGWQRLQQAITMLVGAGHLQPCLSDPASDGRRRKGARTFNDAVMARARYSADLRCLAAPVTGGAVAADRLQQLFLLGLGKKGEDPVSFAWNILKEQNQNLTKNGQTLQGDEDNIAELKRQYSFLEKRLPVLKSVGGL